MEGHEQKGNGVAHVTDDESWLEHFLLLRIFPLLRKAWSTPLTPQMVPPLAAGFQSQHLLRQLDQQLPEGETVSLWRLLWSMHTTELLTGVLVSVMGAATTCIGRPLVLKVLIEAVINPHRYTDTEVVLLVLLFGLVVLFESLLITNSMHVLSSLLMHKWVSWVSSLVMRKACRLRENQVTSEGTLLGNDVVRCLENSKLASMALFSAFGLLFGSLVLIYLLEVAALVGLAVLATLLIIQFRMTGVTKRAEQNSLRRADTRLGLLTEVIGSIKPVKFLSFEPDYEDQLRECRKVETESIQKFRMWQMVMITLGRAAPVLGACASFVYQGYSGESMDAATIFAALAAFQSMRMPLILAPMTMVIIGNIRISFARIEAYLNQPDKPEQPEPPDAMPSGICLNSVEFSWPDNDPEANPGSFETHPTPAAKLVLRGSLEATPGKLVAVVGTVGTGKSSLLAALVGELNLSSGSAHIKGQIGLVPQRAFVISGTVEDNLKMGREGDTSRLKDVIEASGLSRDVELFPDGLNTEIGERGTTLSGGQQQRLGLARALFGLPDVLLLDDPLSAVDAITAQHIMEHAIVPHARRGGVCVVVLNQKHLLKYFDSVVHLDGGAFTQTDLAAFDKVDHEDSTSVAAASEIIPHVELEPSKHRSTVLVEEEELNAGNNIFKTLIQYWNAMGNLGVIAAFVVCTLTYTEYAATDLWLTSWVDADRDNDLTSSETDRYMIVYVGLCLGQLFLTMLTSGMNACLCVKAGRSLHNLCLGQVLKAPMPWFESTPSGRIMSRFSGDISMVDTALLLYYDDSIQMSYILLVLAGIMIYVVPELSAIIAIGFVLFGFAFVAGDRALREVKRAMNNALSPMLSLMSEANQGRVVVQVCCCMLSAGFVHVLGQALGVEPHLKTRFAFAIDEYCRYSYSAHRIQNSCRIVSAFVSFVISVAAALFIMLQREDYEPAKAALALSYAFLMPYFLSIVAYTTSACFTCFTSLERLLQLQVIPQEPQHLLETDKPSWPQTGSITFEKVDLKYRPDLPLAIKSVSFSIKSGEKVGVVGSSGAGKSSLLCLLFRINECSGGVIKIDNINIATVGLRKLRRSMCVIPQEPLRLKGSIKHNLDPFGRHPENMLQIVLNNVGLDRAELEEDMSALSTGEGQLLSLARVLLHREDAKLIVMDEATASIDAQSDARIQKALREYFTKQTFMTIAHRLQTVIDHKIMVMDAGRLVEFGPAAELSAVEGGYFSKMLKTMGAPAIGAKLDQI